MTTVMTTKQKKTQKCF